MTPSVPKGWRVRGTLPKIDLAKASEAELDSLDEDLLHVVDRSGDYAIDVGWYPAASKDGRFICLVVRQDDWDTPLEQLETPNYEMVRRWLKQAVEEITRRVGEPGQFSTRIGVFVSPRKRVGTRKARKEAVAPLPKSPMVSSPVDTRKPSNHSLPQLSSPSLTSPFHVQPALNAP